MRKNFSLLSCFPFFFFFYERSARTRISCGKYPHGEWQPATPNLSNSECEICFASLRNATYSSQLSNKLHLSDVHATRAHVGPRTCIPHTHTHTTALRNDSTCRIVHQTPRIYDFPSSRLRLNGGVVRVSRARLTSTALWISFRAHGLKRGQSDVTSQFSIVERRATFVRENSTPKLNEGVRFTSQNPSRNKLPVTIRYVPLAKSKTSRWLREVFPRISFRFTESSKHTSKCIR